MNFRLFLEMWKTYCIQLSGDNINLFFRINLLIVSKDSFDILLLLRCIETSSDNPPIWLLLYALLSSGPPTFEKLLGGRRLRDSFHLSPVQGYRRENHGDRLPDDGFKSGSIVFSFFFF